MAFTEEEVKSEVIWAMKALYNKGLMTGVGGNASARLPNSEEVWITPSGLYKPRLTEEDLVKIDLEGNVLEGVLKPSMEWHFHTEIYKRRSDVNAIVHAHSPYSTGLAIAGVEIRPITLEAALMLAKVPVVPFKYPGTRELAEEVGKRIMGTRLLILQNHGVIGVGYEMMEAVTAVEILEEVSMMTFIAKLMGRIIEIPPGEIEVIKKLYRI